MEKYVYTNGSDVMPLHIIIENSHTAKVNITI